MCPAACSSAFSDKWKLIVKKAKENYFIPYYINKKICVCVCVCIYIYKYMKVKVLVAQSNPTLCNSMDYSLPSFSVCGILQAIQEWVAMSFSRISSRPMDWTQLSCTAGRFFTIWDTEWAYTHTHKHICIYIHTHIYMFYFSLTPQKILE